MSAKDVRPSSDLPLATQKRDSAKLVSLVALATGAVAMPQTGNADIIYQSENKHVGFGGGDFTSFTLNLPGTVFGFGISSGRVPDGTTAPFYINYRRIALFRAGGGMAQVQAMAGIAFPRGLGQGWDKTGTSASMLSVADVARATFHTFNNTWVGSSQHRPTDDYSNQYLAFRFMNGSFSYYGWVKVSLTAGMSPSVTVSGYAYDTTGAKLGMGVVPEPSSMGILVLGALTLGANGLRAWRRNRPQS